MPPPPVPKRENSRKPPPLPPRAASKKNGLGMTAREKSKLLADSCIDRLSREGAMRMPPPVPRRSAELPCTASSESLTSPASSIGADTREIDHSALLSRPSIRHARKPSRNSRRRPSMLSEAKARMDLAFHLEQLDALQQQNRDRSPVKKDEPTTAITWEESGSSDSGSGLAGAELAMATEIGLDMILPLLKPCVVCATFAFQSGTDGDLPFEKGDMIAVDAVVGSEWLRGRTGKRAGIFPRSFVQLMDGQDEVKTIQPGPDGLWRAIVRFDYAKQQPEDLGLERGKEIIIERPVDEFWYRGRTESEHGTSSPCSGIFPKSYVELVAPGQIKAVATHDYESPRISFKTGEVIELLAKVAPGSKIVGRISVLEGIFPATFVTYDKAHDPKLPIMPEDWRLSSRALNEAGQPIIGAAESTPRIFRPITEETEQEMNPYEAHLPMAGRIKTRKDAKAPPQNCVIA